MKYTAQTILKWFITISFCRLCVYDISQRNLVFTTLPQRDVFEILKNPSLEQPSLTLLHEVRDIFRELVSYANTLIYIQPTITQNLTGDLFEFEYGLYLVESGDHIENAKHQFQVFHDVSGRDLHTLFGQEKLHKLVPLQFNQWYEEPVFTKRAERILSMIINIDIDSVGVLLLLAIIDMPVPLVRIYGHVAGLFLASYLAAMEVCRIILCVELSAEIDMKDFPDKLFFSVSTFLGLVCYVWCTLSDLREFWRSDVGFFMKVLATIKQPLFSTSPSSVDSPPPYKSSLAIRDGEGIMTGV